MEESERVREPTSWLDRLADLTFRFEYGILHKELPDTVIHPVQADPKDGSIRVHEMLWWLDSDASMRYAYLFTLFGKKREGKLPNSRDSLDLIRCLQARHLLRYQVTKDEKELSVLLMDFHPMKQDWMDFLRIQRRRWFHGWYEP